MTNRNGDWMQTITGRKFWPIDPRPEDIDIYDIAHALSMMCRFNGHCERFYSVAEHSIYVSRAVEGEYRKWALVHDAPEIYGIGDVVGPVKPHIAGYKPIEAKIMHAVCDRFNLPHKQPDCIKQADCAILADEAEQIMGPKPDDWYLPFEPTGQKIVGYGPDEAKKMFLDAAEEYGLV